MNDISLLLHNPGEFAEGIIQKGFQVKTAAFLFSVALVGFFLFGFGVGSFVDWLTAVLDGLKLCGTVAFAYALCLPSLYVFMSLAGGNISFGRIATFGLLCIATAGCVLAALSPVLWLFAVSTATVSFILMFTVALAGVAIPFAMRPLDAAVAKKSLTSALGGKAWFVIFTVVFLQTVTMFRPMLAPCDSVRAIPGKCFFVEHFFRTLGAK